jgi:hypothetical protein
MDTLKIKTHRFKFSNNFCEIIEEFTRIHKYDKSKDFKEAWNEWKDDNQNAIGKELKYLQNKDYKGDIYQKIYKSIRYYHKNKTKTENDMKKERKVYVGFNRNILELMDNQIYIHLRKDDSKPSVGFNEFMTGIDNKLLDDQVKILKDHGYTTKEDVLQKFKKTYKNRYFIKQKRK